MKIGFLSDIHGNYDALQVALSNFSERNVDEIICLGDIVGYGAEPGKCVDEISRRAKIVVAGNHDWASVGKTDITYFNRYGREAILWTSEVLMPHQRSFLANLKLSHFDSNWCAVHSTPHEPSRWQYIFSSSDALRQFEYFDRKICLIGHSHIPGVFTDKGDHIQISIPFDESETIVKILGDRRYIVNIGSVGQPRDNDVRGSIVVYDTEAEIINFIRFFYPVPQAQKKILSAGLPRFLADRLEQGI
ncbi:metallophosphoesterase family protein [bacterium]|nr:metallophosphoesterase family protein [bacterium]